MKRAKKYWEMNTAELAHATREFEEPFVMDKARPMTRAERAEERKARRRGRPTVGKGAKKINITIERTLLKAADKLAKEQGLNRSQILARGLSILLKRKATGPPNAA